MMNILKRMSIRARLYFSTVFALALLVLIGAMGYWALDDTRATLKVLMDQKVQVLTDISDVRTTLGDARRVEKDIIINFNNTVEVSNLRATWKKSLDTLRKQLADVRQAQSADAEYTQAIDQSLAAVKQYEDGIAPVFEQIERAQIDGSAAGAYADRVKQHMQAADKLLSDLALKARGQMNAAQQGIESRTATLSGALVGVLLLALFVLVPLTFFSVRGITRSLGQARDLAERIAHGDLSNAIDVRQTDEVGQLVQAMGRMQDALRDLVRQVQQAAESISMASGEIASGNQDLSHRTEQAASNLQVTASSMAQLTDTVQQSATSSRQANQYANSAAEVAARGGAVVSQVVTTMGDINASSKKIADIIGVIDGIAFQTNILALNAAVEAARAGEQGRGFAVVASEVRSLAGRSAAAAKEIKELIGASVDKVEGGTRLVADAGQTMTEIVSSVRRVTDIIGEITAAAAEQSKGIGQVSTSVHELDQMTQQNAALVEQSTAASESLKDQAVQLTRAVSQFKLDDASRGALALPDAPAVLQIAR
jgi:methyl-accepting chemotaxis protein